MAVDPIVGLRLVGGALLLLANGFFVTTEFALTRVPQFSEDDFQGTYGLEKAWEMTERLEIYLSGCQVGITISSVTLGVVAEPAMAVLVSGLFGLLGIGALGSAGHGFLAIVVALGLINLSHVIVGEQAPTYLGVERTKFVARYGAPALYWWTRLMWPFIALSDWVAKAILRVFGVSITRSWHDDEEMSPRELRQEMGEVLSRGTLSSERREEVLNALEIGQIDVEDIMVPAEDIVALSATDPTEANLDRIRAHPEHSRFPLVDGSLDDFLGVVYAPTVVRELEALEAGETELEDVATPPMAVAPDTAVADLIDQFQAENQELALVLDEGDVVGLVTASDAFESITGELRDPFDAEAQTPA